MGKWLGRRDCVIKERGKDRDGKGVKEGRSREPQEQVDREGGSKKKRKRSEMSKGEDGGCGEKCGNGSRIRRFLKRKLKNVTLFPDLVTFPAPS